MRNGHVKRWLTTNKPYTKVFVSYFKFSTTYEKITDVGIPVALSVVFCVWSLCIRPHYASFHSFTTSLVNLVVTVLSILAGFNVASMAVIGAAPGSFVKDLAAKRDEGNRSFLEGLMAMFAWAVLVELLELVLCFAYFALDSLFVSDQSDLFSLFGHHFAKIDVFIPIVSIGLLLTLHAIILSMRNVTGLFLLILKTVESDTPAK